MPKVVPAPPTPAPANMIDVKPRKAARAEVKEERTFDAALSEASTPDKPEQVTTEPKAQTSKNDAQPDAKPAGDAEGTKETSPPEGKQPAQAKDRAEPPVAELIEFVEGMAEPMELAKTGLFPSAMDVEVEDTPVEILDEPDLTDCDIEMDVCGLEMPITGVIEMPLPQTQAVEVLPTEEQAVVSDVVSPKALGPVHIDAHPRPVEPAKDAPALPAFELAGLETVESEPEVEATEPSVPIAQSRPAEAIVEDDHAARILQSPAPPPPPAHTTAPSPAGPATALVAPDVQFAESNHPGIVTAIRGQLLPEGGTMQISLDPPELGALHVRIELRDGLINASFQTSSDDATRLLSHSLTQLKQTLEAQGVSVDKLQVQQAPRDQQPSFGRDDGQRQQQALADQNEQQRREMLQRMWRRVAGDRDPLDLLV